MAAPSSPSSSSSTTFESSSSSSDLSPVSKSPTPSSDDNNSTSSSSSSGLSSLGSFAQTDIRITYESDEGTPLEENIVNHHHHQRPQLPSLIINNNCKLLRQNGNNTAAAAVFSSSLPSAFSSPSLSECGIEPSSSSSIITATTTTMHQQQKQQQQQQQSLMMMNTFNTIHHNHPNHHHSNNNLNLMIKNNNVKNAAHLRIQGLIFDQQQHLLISRATSMDEGIFQSPLNSPNRTSAPSSPIGPKFKIIHEGDVHLCRLNHQRTIVSKILSSKFLRRWETHRIYLTTVNMASKTPIGFMEVPVPYSQIENAYAVNRWDTNQKFYIRIVVSDGSVLLQLPNKWVRDQWLYSINWKRFMLKYQQILANPSIRPDVLTKELKNLIELTLTTPLQDECIYQTSLDVINELLLLRLKDFERDDEKTAEMQLAARKLNEEIIKLLSPFLERTNPSIEICRFLSKHCRKYPRSIVICEYYAEIVQRILKHNMDFGKYPRMRVLVQDYFVALNKHNDGNHLIQTFIYSVHGRTMMCPHPRVISNLVSVCLATIFSLFEYRQLDSIHHGHQSIKNVADTDLDQIDDEEWQIHVNCFIDMFRFISQYEDWRLSLAQILQPIPLPDSALGDPKFFLLFKPVIENLANDHRCDVHQMLLGIRENKSNWLDLYAPGNIGCDDDGQLWSIMLKTLIGCCCRRKRFYQVLIKSSLDACLLLALREDETCQTILCDMIEMELIENSSDVQQQIITTLQSTSTGQQQYDDLCQRQLHLREFQKKGGPKKLTLPSRSTDADLARLLSAGSFGDLESLSLAFTQVTSASAHHLIKLPSLRYLNLWSTQFSDSGLQLLAEHLTQLQVLNLCETPVTDKGLLYLTALKDLRKLNLNSTNLSSQTYEKLKQKLPSLQEVDVRYTDAW
ncbi:C-Maf-inducing protein-like [Dermatophagoides farinae]|uniref:C-Maf-inducing protein-like n=1 Tax=Dermatophagoides farinae TaxID=6954 RepID=UPI003F5E46B5